MDLGLKDKRALVIGSMAGIGLATARALAREGAMGFVERDRGLSGAASIVSFYCLPSKEMSSGSG